MDSQTDPLAQAIGVRVKRERIARGWTLDQLAERSGVSRRMIINVEQAAANPSLETLLRISDALGMGLPALVEPPAAKTVKVTRAGEGATLWRGELGGYGMLMAGTEPPNVVELWEWVLPPGDRHDSDPHASGTRELLHVTEGSITVSAGAETYDLVVGDTVSFYADVEHSYHNPHDAQARFVLCAYEPGVGIAHGSDTESA